MLIPGFSCAFNGAWQRNGGKILLVLLITRISVSYPMAKAVLRSSQKSSPSGISPHVDSRLLISSLELLKHYFTYGEKLAAH